MCWLYCSIALYTADARNFNCPFMRGISTALSFPQVSYGEGSSSSPSDSGSDNVKSKDLHEDGARLARETGLSNPSWSYFSVHH